MKKPSWFSVWDFISFVVPSLAILAVLVYGGIVGFKGENATQGVLLTCTVLVGFVAIAIRFCWLKKKAFDQFTWYPTYGFMVHGNGYTLPSMEVFDASVKRTIEAWRLYHPTADTIVRSETNWVYFIKDLNENDKNPTHTKVNGYTFARSHTMAANFNNASDPFEQTAFEHELGHVIRGYATGNWDMAEHHQFAAQHALR